MAKDTSATAAPSKAEMAKMEKKWQAERDLRTLIDAEVIKKDSARFKAALKAHAEAAKEVAKIQKEEGAAVEALKAAAGT